jgi:hypothetical protein
MGAQRAEERLVVPRRNMRAHLPWNVANSSKQEPEAACSRLERSKASYQPIPDSYCGGNALTKETMTVLRLAIFLLFCCIAYPAAFQAQAVAGKDTDAVAPVMAVDDAVSIALENNRLIKNALLAAGDCLNSTSRFCNLSC